MSTGARLKKFMKENHVTQKVLAAESGIAQSSVSRIINDEQPITFDLIRFLYLKYQLNPIYFID